MSCSIPKCCSTVLYVSRQCNLYSKTNQSFLKLKTRAASLGQVTHLCPEAACLTHYITFACVGACLRLIT